MKKFIRKLSLMSLGLALSASVITSCGNNGGSSTPPPSGSTTSASILNAPIEHQRIYLSVVNEMIGRVNSNSSSPPSAFRSSRQEMKENFSFHFIPEAKAADCSSPEAIACSEGGCLQLVPIGGPAPVISDQPGGAIRIVFDGYTFGSDNSSCGKRVESCSLSYYTSGLITGQLVGNITFPTPTSRDPNLDLRVSIQTNPNTCSASGVTIRTSTDASQLHQVGFDLVGRVTGAASSARSNAVLSGTFCIDNVTYTHFPTTPDEFNRLLGLAVCRNS